MPPSGSGTAAPSSPPKAKTYAAARDAAAQVFLRERTADGFDNFVSRIGLQNDNTLSASTYEFNLITRNRILLEAAYRGSWIVGQVVDCVADDMTRAGIDVTTATDVDLKKLHTNMVRRQIWTSLRNLIGWGRLYGGALGVIQIEGQNLATPLNIDTVAKDQFKGIVVYDRWMLNPVLTPVIESGPNMGLPKLYQIVTTWDSTDPQNPRPAGGLNVHHSRCIRYTGIDLPYMQAITEQMWGESILERLWDRLIAFDNATMSSASLIDRANLRSVGVEGLREIIAAGGKAQEGLEKMFEMIRAMQTNMGITLLDKNDDWHTDSYTFTGLADMLLQFGQQLAGASNIPLVRLFSQSPAGLNSTGDSDIRMYYDGINAQQEAKLRNPMETLLKIEWRSTYGTEPPDDLEFSFTPLWQMSANDKATVAKTNTETVLGAFEAQLIKPKTALQELRDLSGDTGVFSNITEDDIDEAEEMELAAPPAPDAPEALESPEAKQLYPGKPEDEGKEPVKALDAKFGFWSWLRKTLDADFKESDHPRKDDGEFGQGGGGGAGSGIHEKDKDAAIDFLAGHIKDKDWDSFMDQFDAASEKAEVKKVEPKEAATFKRSHNFTFENDPDNESMHKANKQKRGKEVNDPAVVLEFNGDHYVLDGQHRLNKAIKENRPANVAIVKGDFLKKFGITEKTFEGKKAH